MDPKERKHTIEDFRAGRSRVLVSSDLLARGIDIQQISLVINYELPMNRENYVHRIGRAGRFGRKGTTINMLLPEEEAMMTDICEHYKMKVTILPENLSTLL